MNNPIRIRTNSKESKHYDIYLYDNKKLFESDVDELSYQENVKVLYSGRSDELVNLGGQIKVETHVSFFDETSRQLKFGVVINTKTTPYYEIEEDKTRYRYSVHVKHINNMEFSFKKLAELFIQKIKENKYRKYDLGVVKIQAKTFLTAGESLIDLTSKGVYSILLSTEL